MDWHDVSSIFTQAAMIHTDRWRHTVCAVYSWVVMRPPQSLIFDDPIHRICSARTVERKNLYVYASNVDFGIMNLWQYLSRETHSNGARKYRFNPTAGARFRDRFICLWNRSDARLSRKWYPWKQQIETSNVLNNCILCFGEGLLMNITQQITLAIFKDEKRFPLYSQSLKKKQNLSLADPWMRSQSNSFSQNTRWTWETMAARKSCAYYVHP